jgi:hypothetical protein
VSATTWRVFNRATVAQAYAEPAPVALEATAAEADRRLRIAQA